MIVPLLDMELVRRLSADEWNGGGPWGVGVGSWGVEQLTRKSSSLMMDDDERFS